ncbi:hypothetical protein M408DRAFT_13288 [Serendipita vermifera MAFF 305830]|uniref:Expansin-like EG45 domain-containing protein n=1 Tax=Serendipita vermifera MAFF 305830 TaxID=933852 RepID=A0A0C3AKJ9_SERVB|nr:hypothetical protein M408DRAFT_13288 [Serendipita vermifera MAFF 305830]
MLTRQILVLVAGSYSAWGYALNARSIEESWATLVANVPPACTTLCTGMGELATINFSDPSTATPFCTTAVEDAFNACGACYEENAPQIFTPTILADGQTLVDQFVTICNAQGSPLPSIVIPSPTASASGSASATAAPSASTTPAPSASSSSSRPATSSTTSSRSGALGRRSNLVNVGAAGFLAVIGMIFFA